MTKRAYLGLKTPFSTTLVHFAEKCFGAPDPKLKKRSELGLKPSFLYNLYSAENTLKLCAQCWSRAENAILYTLVHFADSR